MGVLLYVILVLAAVDVEGKFQQDEYELGQLLKEIRQEMEDNRKKVMEEVDDNIQELNEDMNDRLDVAEGMLKEMRQEMKDNGEKLTDKMHEKLDRMQSKLLDETRQRAEAAMKLISRKTFCERRGFKWLEAGFCYKAVHTPKASWATAKKRCANLGAHLAVIDSHVESDVVNAWLKSVKGSLWIGGHRVSGQWRWDHTGEPFTYTNWHTGYPRGNDGCVFIGWHPNYQWTSWRCGYRQNYLCELSM